MHGETLTLKLKVSLYFTTRILIPYKNEFSR